MPELMFKEYIDIDKEFQYGLFEGEVQAKGRPSEEKVFNPTVFHSLLHAFEGLTYTFFTERNFRIQLIAAAAVIALGLIRGIALDQMLLLWFSIILVMACEIINTALELTLDVVSNHKYHPVVKTAKDVLAAAVLLAAVNALVVGIVVFL